MIHLHEAYEFIESNPVTTAEILAEVLGKKWSASKDSRPEWRPADGLPGYETRINSEGHKETRPKE
jgi:ABC-type nitrate/sulfonate/bicarbonate transport system substrate-binding protein